MDESKTKKLTTDCCDRLFYAHCVKGARPLIVLECCFCGRLWHRREDKRIVPYDRTLVRALQHAE